MKLSERFEVYISYDVWDNEEGIRLRVGPDEDGGDWVQISTPDTKSKEWFGDIRFVIPPEYALQLADAIKAYATNSIAKREAKNDN